MITIALSQHKGGVGKTVSAMALSVAFARTKHPSLLVDLDPQGHSTIGLGVELGDTDSTIRHFFEEPSMPLDKLIRKTHVAGVDLIPSNIGLAKTALRLVARRRREELLRVGLRPIASRYDFAVLDCPPSLGVLADTAIDAADFVIIPCMMEARAADGLVDLLEILSLLKGEAFDRWRILLTRVDSRKSITNEAVMSALAPWKDKILATSIPQSEPLNQAQIARTDIFSFDPSSKGALAYEALAQEVLTHVQ